MKRDEKAAQKAEAEEEERLAARDRSDRIDQLRKQRDAAAGRPIKEEPFAPVTHVNFFSDIEETDVKPLRSQLFGQQQVELAPWYTQADCKSGQDRARSEEDRERARLRDEKRKCIEDPLASIPAFAREKKISTKEPSRGSLAEKRHVREAEDAKRTDSLLKERAFFREETRASRYARVRRKRHH